MRWSCCTCLARPNDKLDFRSSQFKGKALETVSYVKSKKVHDISLSAGKMPGSNAKESKSSARVEIRGGHRGQLLLLH